MIGDTEAGREADRRGSVAIVRTQLDPAAADWISAALLTLLCAYVALTSAAGLLHDD